MDSRIERFESISMHLFFVVAFAGILQFFAGFGIAYFVYQTKSGSDAISYLFGFLGIAIGIWATNILWYWVVLKKLSTHRIVYQDGEE